MRFGLYAGVSSALAVGAVARACLERPNFYSSSVYIAQSNACLFILTNLALLTTYSAMLGLQKSFYGPLRPVEIEQLWEKAWFALTETALAMTIFRDEGRPPVQSTTTPETQKGSQVVPDAVEILEQQPPANPRLFHTRLSAALSLSVLFNVYMLRFCASSVLQQARPNMMVMFAFEFAVLTVLSLSTTARYALSLYETAVITRQIADGREQLRRRTEDPLSEEEANSTEIDAAGWEEKGQWMFYLDIATGIAPSPQGRSQFLLMPQPTDFFKLVLYLTFFCVLCMFYGMPIHIIRDVALTIRSFYKRIRDFVQYKHATRDMNSRYPDATAEEILREDVCIICRENMTVWQSPTTSGVRDAPRVERQPIDERQRAKKLPCGHLLHFACLRSWLERQQICPTCRTPVLSNNPAPANPNQPAEPNVRGAPGANNARAAGPHVYTFGPFRLVFGARHIDNNHAAAVAAAAAANTAGDPSHAVLQNRNPIPLSSVTVQAQLTQIEQHITHEISHLSHLSDQLHIIRALQAELARIRASQANAGNSGPTLNHQLRQPFGIPAQQSVQAFREVLVGSDQRNMPAGLTIPDGWSLHALQRVPGNAHRGPAIQDSVPGPAQQQQDRTDSGVSSSPGISSSSAQPSEAEANSGSVPTQDLGSSDAIPKQTPGHPEGSATSPNEPLASLPRWGSTSTPDGRQLAESSSETETGYKGKGRAVTVEDEVD
ncbi:MAG: hypothetical protein Q9200_000134 [Gallowayella weberi]